MRAVIVWLIKGGFNSPIFAPFKSGHKPTFNGEKWVILGGFSFTWYIRDKCRMKNVVKN